METSTDKKRNIFLLSMTSDIGTALAERYFAEGHGVVGTYRSGKKLDKFKKISEYLFHCDIGDKESVNNFIREYKKLNLKWDTFISCVGTQKPIGKFLEGDFDEWSDSIHTNSIEQLRVLHELYPLRDKSQISNAVFFAGGGTNNAFPNYSAYTASKIILIKMCELIDSETEDLNIFIPGPGLTKTKMHYETLNENKEKIGSNYDKIEEFMKKGGGTLMDDIYECIEWLCKQGKEIAGGRNFSVVHDKWGNKNLAKILKSNSDVYKLRRYGNEIKIKD